MNIFLKILSRNAKVSLSQKSKELLEEWKFPKVACNRLIVCDRRLRLGNVEERDSNVSDL